jgi:hypothetical protein
MRKAIIIIGGAVGAFLIWQLLLSKKDPGLARLEKRLEENDKAGKAQERLQMGSRPRLADPERAGLLGTILASENGLWSQLLPNGEINNDPYNKVKTASPVNPFIFGYGEYPEDTVREYDDSIP